MREIVHIQAGQCGNQIGAKVSYSFVSQTSNFERGAYIAAGILWRRPHATTRKNETIDDCFLY